MSFASSLKKLLPGNKSERGHTLRKRGYHFSELIDDASGPSASYGQQDSADKLVRRNEAIEPAPSDPSISRVASPGSRTQQLYLERREKRRLRRSLKESGDFLGVQGINPATGELDVLTPSSSSAGDFSSLARAVQDRKESYENARRQLEAEKMRKWERDKQAIRAEHRNKVRWKKKTSGWSSAIEPNLSPIAQSSAATSPRGEVSTETVVRTPSVRRSSDGYSVQSHGPGTTLPGRASSSITSGLRASAPSEDRMSVLYKPKSQPSSASHRVLSSRRSYSDLIPVESEFPPDPSPKPPKVGPKPVGWQPGQRSTGRPSEITPSDSISVAGASRSWIRSQGTTPRSSRRSEDQREERSQWRTGRARPTTARNRSASSALGFRSASTPESYLDFPKTGPFSRTSRQPSLDSGQTSSSAPAKRESPRIVRSDGVTFQGAGAVYRKAKDIADGRVCLHTHHHHYWILSDSIALQAIPKQLRSSRERMPLQKADGNTRRAGNLAGFPDEGDMEDLAESRQAPSRNTNRRYFIDG